jgi:hypothetical protein
MDNAEMCVDVELRRQVIGEMQAALVAARLVLGLDRHCLNYIRAYRVGLFNGSDAKASRK